MADNHIKAEKDYVKGMKYKDIAEKYDVSINTVKSWKRRHEWSREKGAPKTKGVHTKTKGAPKGNINAKGNSGGAAPKRNTNSVTHGLFSKYLPQETLDIVEQTEDITPVDILWMNIKMQFAQIMRSQQIMHVKDKDDLTRELKKKKPGAFGDEQEWEIRFAWDKQANFLNAQSRAMGELRSMLKQFIEMSHYDDDRAIEAERMAAVINKTKAETEKIINEHGDEDIEEIVIVDEWGDNDEQ